MAAASNTRKSLPKPCIFRNSMRIPASIADAANFRSGVAYCALDVLPYEHNKDRGIMRHVMVLNAKGGCGKSTLSTNIAVFFARDGHKVCIADYDSQRTSLDWLGESPGGLPAIR